jgi:RHS repeat-associated protein
VANLTMERTSTGSTLTESVSINGQAFVCSYDLESRTFTDTTPQGRQSITKIDPLGRLIEHQVSGLFPTRFAYDAEGRLTSITSGIEGDGRSMSLDYTTEGSIDTITDPLLEILNLDFDLAGRLTGVTMPDSRKIVLTRNAKGNITSIVPPGQPAHMFEYNAVDLMDTYIPPEVGAETGAAHYSFNKDREVTEILRPDGQAIDFVYDSGGRLSSLEFSRGATTYDYFSTTGQLKSISAPGGVIVNYEYDGLLLTAESWSGPVTGSVDFDYDNSFRRTGLTINNDSAIVFLYDNDHLMTQAGSMTLAYNSQNDLLAETALGEVTDTWSYNGFGEPVGYAASFGGSPIFEIQFAYNKQGQIIEKTEIISGVTDVWKYIYDESRRLTQVEKNGAVASAYTYDSNDNRLTGPYASTTYSYDARDRLLAVSSSLGTQSYSYSANGELQSKTLGGNETTYEYDELGNLTAVSLPDGTAVQYIVDGRNRRIGKKIGGMLVQGFLYADELKPIAELDGSGNILSVFVYGNRYTSPEYMIKAGESYRIIADHLGSPRLIIHATTGAIAQRMDYDEFGNVTLDSNPGFQPFGFAGGIYDQHTKLTRFGARDYSADIGRWTARDPILFNGNQTNFYVYVNNDPVNRFDPSGTFWEKIKACHWGYKIYQLIKAGKDAQSGEDFADNILESKIPSEGLRIRLKNWADDINFSIKNWLQEKLPGVFR